MKDQRLIVPVPYVSMGSGASQNRSPSVRNDPTYELFRQAFEDLPLSSRPSSVDRITELLSQTETTTLPTKTWILREEEEPLGIYLIVSGSVEICIERDGLVESLRHLERGMFFGELSTLFGATCSASARTRVDKYREGYVEYRLWRKVFSIL